MVLQYIFLSLYDEVTNVLCVSLLSHNRCQYDTTTLDWPTNRREHGTDMLASKKSRLNSLWFDIRK